jgi:enamine deaminase RidA (YjgF/YER057c/UK114 family)
VPLPALPCPVRLAAVAAAAPPPDVVFIPGQLSTDQDGGVLHRGDIAAQTRLVMTRLGAELERARSGFSDLVKVTVHYVGTARPENLHRNLEIRSQFYAPPGPSSTGVPVTRLEPDGALIVVEAIAARG